MRLTIELYGSRLGTIHGDARTFDFVADASAVDRFGAGSTALSVAIPLTVTPRRDHAGRRRNWFAELLPEGDQYEYMVGQAGIRRGDVPAFLARYGRDVAGALQIWDLDDPTQPLSPGLRPLTAAGVRALLEDPIGSPLANDPRAGRSSLGGVQPKVVLVRTDDGWAQALGGYPSTHILKPQLPGDNRTVIFDEEYGSRIARRMGLSPFDSGIEDMDGLPTLVIERFDRSSGVRVHQEDFSQALGASGIQKYQEFGGVVSLRRAAEVLTRHARERDLRRLARMIVLAVGIGNLDLHTKNLGLLHHESGDIELAPAYDVVPQAHSGTEGTLALAVNKKYRLAEITRDDLQHELTSWGLRRAGQLVVSTVDELAATVGAEEPLEGAASNLKSMVTTFVQNLAEGRAVGAR